MTGAGAYGGTAEASFEILPKSIEGLTLELNPYVVASDGEAAETDVILRDGDTVITDLTLTFDGSTFGDAVVTVEAHGNYTGTLYGVYMIVTRSDLSTFTLPSALTHIEEESFMGLNAQRIIIPAGCEEIGENAFAECYDLVEVDILSDNVVIADNAFGSRTDFTIRAADGSSAAQFAASHGIHWIPID